MTNTTAPALRGTTSRPLSTRRRRALAAAEAVVGVNALGGMAYALGGARAVPSERLDGTPFDAALAGRP